MKTKKVKFHKLSFFVLLLTLLMPVTLLSCSHDPIEPQPAEAGEQEEENNNNNNNNNNQGNNENPNAGQGNNEENENSQNSTSKDFVITMDYEDDDADAIEVKNNSVFYFPNSDYSRLGSFGYKSKSFYIRNTKSEPIEIFDFKIEGEVFYISSVRKKGTGKYDYFRAVDDYAAAPIVLQSEEKLELNIYFKPKQDEEADYETTFSFKTNTQVNVFSLTFKGHCSRWENGLEFKYEGNIYQTNTKIPLSAVWTGDEAEYTFTVRNIGYKNIPSIASITVEDTQSYYRQYTNPEENDFSISESVTISEDNPVKLDPGVSYDFKIKFKASKYGYYEGKITIKTSDNKTYEYLVILYSQWYEPKKLGAYEIAAGKNEKLLLIEYDSAARKYNGFIYDGQTMTDTGYSYEEYWESIPYNDGFIVSAKDSLLFFDGNSVIKLVEAEEINWIQYPILVNNRLYFINSTSSYHTTGDFGNIYCFDLSKNQLAKISDDEAKSITYGSDGMIYYYDDGWDDKIMYMKESEIKLDGSSNAWIRIKYADMGLVDDYNNNFRIFSVGSILGEACCYLTQNDVKHVYKFNQGQASDITTLTSKHEYFSDIEFDGHYLFEYAGFYAFDGTTLTSLLSNNSFKGACEVDDNLYVLSSDNKDRFNIYKYENNSLQEIASLADPLLNGTVAQEGLFACVGIDGKTRLYFENGRTLYEFNVEEQKIYIVYSEAEGSEGFFGFEASIYEPIQWYSYNGVLYFVDGWSDYLYQYSYGQR